MTEQEQEESAQDFTISLLEIVVTGPMLVERVNELLREGHRGLRVKYGMSKVHVMCLLRMLRAIGIELSDKQVRELRDLDSASLPALDVAVLARDASDFARNAGISINA